MPTERCSSHNGTYACQFIHKIGTRHAGMHYAYYVSGGRAYIAEWVDSYGQVSHREAPVPESKKR
jgi:hypothetical protein